jgi:hypothetical protein
MKTYPVDDRRVLGSSPNDASAALKKAGFASILVA